MPMIEVGVILLCGFFMGIVAVLYVQWNYQWWRQRGHAGRCEICLCQTISRDRCDSCRRNVGTCCSWWLTWPKHIGDKPSIGWYQRDHRGYCPECAIAHLPSDALRTAMEMHRRGICKKENL